MGAKTSKKNRIKEIQKKKIERKELIDELKPIVKSFGLWILLVILVAADYTNHRWFSMLFVDLTTYLSYGLSKILFIPAEIAGKGVSTVTTLEINYRNIIIDQFPMLVELECSAYHAYMAMISLVIFSPWTLRQKLTIGPGLFVLLAIINSFRIVILGIIGHQFPQLFNLMHDYIWNILLVIIIWALWEIISKKLRKQNDEKLPS